MEREGSLNILKYGDRFDVTFSRYDWTGGVMSPCKVEGRDALAALLERKVHILPEMVKDILRQLKRKETVHVPNIRLTDNERLELGLVSPDERLSRDDIHVNDKVRVREKVERGHGSVVFLTPVPDLTVVKIESKNGEDIAWCEWKDGNKTRTAQFPRAWLQKA